MSNPLSQPAGGERMSVMVERSATARRWLMPRPDEGRMRELARRFNLGEVAARILAARGYDEAAARAFLTPSLNALTPQPSPIAGLEAAAERLARAICQGESIGVLSDYDVDGVTCAAMLARFLRLSGARLAQDALRIPDRRRDGYGPNPALMDAFAASGTKLLLTADCGTTAHASLAHAAKLGLEVIVADHHVCPETLPPAVAVVNPRRCDDASGLGDLAACGVVFLLLVAVNRKLRRRGRPCLTREAFCEFVVFAAIGTVCDVVPLRGFNRALVGRGLALMERESCGNMGLAALARVARHRGGWQARDFAFTLGPRLNAGGRMDDAMLGVRLLLAEDDGEALRLAEQLDALNRRRRASEEAALAQAFEQLGGVACQGAAFLLVHGAWNVGILGLVASRLCERFDCPAFAFAPSHGGGLLSGSARAPRGVDLAILARDAVAEGLAVKAGGHARAAGFTIRESGVEALRSWLKGRCGRGGASDLVVDCALDGAGAGDPCLVPSLAPLAPWGSGNRSPCFFIGRCDLRYVAATEGGHVRIAARGAAGMDFRAFAFRRAGTPLHDFLRRHEGRGVRLAATPIMDGGGGRRLTLLLDDAASL